MKKLVRKLTAVLVSAVFICGGFHPVHAEGSEKDFDQFLRDRWIEMMEKDYTSMHFSVSDYRAMGIEKGIVSLGEVGYGYYRDKADTAKTNLENLHEFPLESLNDTERHDYITYERYLEDEIARSSYPEYKELFNPYNGDVTDIRTVLTEFVFYEKEDIDDYLTLLEDYDRFCYDALEFTKQQAEQGYFMLDSVLDVELERLGDFAAKKEDNPFIVIFEKNVDAFEGLTDEERTAYKERNRAIVLNEIIPVTELSKTELEKLRGKRSVQKSLYHYPDGKGKDYYLSLAQYKTSTRLSLQEMLDYLSDAVVGMLQKNGELINKDPTKLIPPVVRGFNTPEEMLNHLKNNLQSFPEGPEVNFTLSYLDRSVANPSTIAYYVVCPVDDIRDNVIRINGDLTGNNTTKLYTTLAHEGFAGHLYQKTWYYSTSPNPIRHDLSMMGYQEGWAQYVVRDLLYRSGLDPASAMAVYLTDYTAYALQAAFDIAVNGLGYETEELLAWTKSLGLSLSESSIDEIANAVSGSPAQILPYGFGQMKFHEFRDRMIRSLGEEYDEVEFNRQLLLNGNRPFELVEEDLQNYCEARGKTFVTDYEFFSSDEIIVDPKTERLIRFAPFILLGILILTIVIIVLIIRGILKLFRKKKAKPAEDQSK